LRHELTICKISHIQDIFFPCKSILYSYDNIYTDFIAISVYKTKVNKQ
jgi:hypothetical protein